MPLPGPLIFTSFAAQHTPGVYMEDCSSVQFRGSIQEETFNLGVTLAKTATCELRTDLQIHEIMKFSHYFKPLYNNQNQAAKQEAS